MEVKELFADTLFVSELNVRKTLTSEEDETGISDLANDIRINGLINPLTVRKQGDKYEIIAGQRRFLACNMLKKETIPCNIVNVSAQKAEEISLVENVQRNQMTNYDKIKTYSKLYNVYNKDLEKVINAVHISRLTLNKYLKLNTLSDDIIRLLDVNTDDKITIDVAVELTKLSNETNKLDIIKHIQSLTTAQKISAIKEFVKNNYKNADDIIDIKEDIAISHNNIVLAPSFPYVIDVDNRKIKIPEELYTEVVLLIKSKVSTIQYV